jgi:hypothetical protein
MTTVHLGARLDDQNCEVSFFRAWTSYAHPVTLVDPLSLEQALQRGKYQRAWMCHDNGEPRFLLLETVENKTEPIELQGGTLGTAAAGTVSAFEARTDAAGEPALGRPLRLDELVGARGFIAALPLEGQGAGTRTLLVSQKVISSFRYRYGPDGALASVTTVNPEGKINVLDYSTMERLGPHPPTPPPSGPLPGGAWGTIHRALLSPGSRRIALAVMAGSVFFPVSGLGVDLCPLHRVTGLPCPGCGLTRAMAAMSQGDLSSALGLNPFVLFAWPVFVVLALLALVPPAWRERVERRLDAHGPALTRAYRIVLAAFVGFGALRLVLVLALRVHFP